jgi:16S rRNA (guanine527-N7)-methyltransferase
VIAAVLPDIAVTLVEPLQKRAKLLAAMAQELRLVNVRVEPTRAEQAGRGPLRESADLVTARAVAPLAELLEYTVPLARVGGEVILPKGSGLPGELDAAQGAMARLGCALLAMESAREQVAPTLTFAAFGKLAPTAASYPRRPGMPSKRPLQNS